MAGVELTWLDPVNLEDRDVARDVAGAVALLEAARIADYPHEQTRTLRAYMADLRHGWDGEPAVAAVTRDPRGRVVGLLEVSLPRRDNTHLAFVDVTVDPIRRREGLGGALFEAGVARANEEGRTLVMAECFNLPYTLAFAKALSLDPAMDEVKRRQDMCALDWTRLDTMFAEAQSAASDYELVRLPGTIPDVLMPAVVEMIAAINDAPTEGLDVEDEIFSAERVRAFRAAQDAHGRRTYQLAARHRDTGVLSGHTVAGVESELPFFGHQFDTSVLSGHRGHRLGLLLKIGMLRWLAEAEPQLRTFDTWNAASNAHMIRVNEALGYQVVATATAFQRHL